MSQMSLGDMREQEEMLYLCQHLLLQDTFLWSFQIHPLSFVKIS